MASAPSSSPPQALPRIVTLSEIEKIVSIPSFAAELVDAIRDGFTRHDAFYMAPIQTLGCPPASPPFQRRDNHNNDEASYGAQTCVKTGYFVNGDHYVIKVASGGHPFPANSGLMQVYSQTTGRLEALLLDEGVLTELRTAAVGTLACQLFAPRRVQCVGMLGCGVQARYQLRMLGQVCDSQYHQQHRSSHTHEEPDLDLCRNALVYGRDPVRATAYADEMKGCGWSVEMATNPHQLLDECDVIFTTTSSRNSLLSLGAAAAARPSRTRLLVCIGSDAPGKSEVCGSLLRAADLRVADAVEQSRERGEFQSLSRDLPIVSLKDALLDPTKGLRRRSPRAESDGSAANANANTNGDEGEDGDGDDDRLVVFDSSGLALQDCVIASMVYQAVDRSET